MIRFDRTGVDVARRIVELDGEPQHLEPQAFDLLAYLVAHRDRVVPKTELLDEVWGDQFVSESALTTRIKEVRRALGDDGARQKMVRNYRGRGYRFVAEPASETKAQSGTPGDRPVMTSLQGRTLEIADVIELVRDSPVVTLTGPGGVGKSTLALEVARHVAPRHPQGVTVVRLAPVSEPLGVAHVLRESAGLADAGPTEHDLIAALSEIDGLLVVDNCEQVIDEAARLIDAISAKGGPVRVLATSRERLGIRSEQVRPIRPLDPDSARALLVERVRSLQPGWSAEESSLDRLVDLVDRLPLAIEMAAARLPTVGVDELVELLTDRLDLLRLDDRTAEDRHSTLPALIDWSEQLLAPAARSLLAELSVFAGPVGAADISRVVDLDVAELVVGPLAELVDHSLVVADTSEQPTRYHLLETVRACVAGRRDPSIDERHSRYVIGEVRRVERVLRTPGEPDAVARIESLTAEIRTAHAWARAHDVSAAADLSASLLHYSYERYWAEPADWNRRLLDLAGDDDELAAPAAASLAADASNRGDYELAASLAQRAAGSADPVVASSALDTLANVGLYTGDLDASRRHSADLLQLGEETGDPTIWTLGVLGEAMLPLYWGDAGQARARLDEARSPAPLSVTSQAWLAYAEGEVCAGEGRFAEAVQWFDRSIELATSVRGHFVIAVARVSALAPRSRVADPEDAMRMFAPVLTYYRRTRSLTHAVTALRNLIALLVRCERDEPAAVLLGALASTDIKSTYGTESQLLAEADHTIGERNPADQVESWKARGAPHDVVWALDFAIALLAAD